MNANQFENLCILLGDHLPLTKKLPVIVQVAIFLDWICFASTYRLQRNKYKLSHKLIKTARRNVARAIVQVIYPRFVKQPTAVPHINNPRYYQFNGCCGCIDGSHIPLQVPTSLQQKWRNRKGFVSTNALAVCSMEMPLSVALVYGRSDFVY